MIKLTTALSLTIGLSVSAASAEDLLIKVASPVSTERAAQTMSANGLKTQVIMPQWLSVKGNVTLSQLKGLKESGQILHVQKNYKLNVYKNPSLVAAQKNPALQKMMQQKAIHTMAPSTRPDNLPFPATPISAQGADPLFSKQWGMVSNDLENVWKVFPGKEIVVAVIDTGVDYTHEDLAANMWKNTKEIPDNGVDDDNNGYIDDIVGWDTLDNDNKPYDLASDNMTDLFRGANPGHGTHCAGNVAAVGNNGKGIAGIHPSAKIMALRFIGDSGGSTEGAIKAIRYAVDNGAKILSNSWGSEGEDPNEADMNQALRDAVQYAQDKGVLFIAAAANSGKDNDKPAAPAYPASYPHDNIISVAAIDSKDGLADFSNYGATTVDIGAPGVKIFSTVPTKVKYADEVIPLMANWDGTSMAAPHVSGAAALYWSEHPEKTWQEVKAAILESAKPIPSLAGKTLTGAKLAVDELMKR